VEAEQAKMVGTLELRGVLVLLDKVMLEVAVTVAVEVAVVHLQ
jgi:hypothetical protein